MNGFVLDEKYTSKETGIEYYFYCASTNLEKGTFWQKDSKSFHELDYSIMQTNKDLSGNYTIKHDCEGEIMSGFIPNEKYTNIETGIDYYFYAQSIAPKIGIFYSNGGGYTHFNYSEMTANKDLFGEHTIKYDCITYIVNKEIKERFDAIIKEAQEYSN